MGELYKIALSEQEFNENKRVLREAENARRLDEIDQMYIDRDEMKNALRVKREQFGNYKDSVKKILLAEAMKRIYVGSIKNPSSEETACCEAFLGNFINERGVDELIMNFKSSRTTFLETVSNLIEEYQEKIVGEADPEDPTTFTVDKEHLDNFVKDMEEKEDVEDVTQTIRMRVASAEEEFINKNEIDRQNVKSILDDTSNRIKDARPNLDNDYEEDSDDEMDEEVKQEQVMMAKQKIDRINSRPRTVFDRMVHSVSEAVLTNPELRSQYMGENGRMDMDKIVGSVRCMYTLLEMVSTLKIEKVDAKYIEDTINSI